MIMAFPPAVDLIYSALMNHFKNNSGITNSILSGQLITAKLNVGPICKMLKINIHHSKLLYLSDISTTPLNVQNIYTSDHSLACADGGGNICTGALPKP
jgi:hypothetical protein